MTPLELDLALKDHSDYHNSYLKHFMYLLRYIGVILRNKGLKMSDQIMSVKKFWQFPWEQDEEVKVLSKQDWQALDRKYFKNKK